MRQRSSPVESLAAVDDLREWAGDPGPLLSVHMSFRPPGEDLAQRIALAWRAAREEAAAAGAPEPVLAAADDVVADGPSGPEKGVTVLARPEGGRHVERLVVPPVDLVRWEPTPALTPLLAARQQAPTHVVALVDREGADLLLGAGPRAPGEPAAEVHGDDYPLTKVAAGGWSQRRIQQRAEETWHHNMSAVAQELARVVDRARPAVVAVGGDERAVTLLLEALPVAVRENVRRIHVTRAADGSEDELDREVARLVAEYVDEEMARGLDAYREELGQHDRATAGADDTLAALSTARVALLLTPLGHRDDRRAWIGGDRRQVGLTRDALADPDGAQQAPLVDAAVAAALATGAGVRVVPDDMAPPGGLGALLRW